MKFMRLAIASFFECCTKRIPSHVGGGKGMEDKEVTEMHLNIYKTLKQAFILTGRSAKHVQ